MSTKGISECTSTNKMRGRLIVGKSSGSHALVTFCPSFTVLSYSFYQAIIFSQAETDTGSLFFPYLGEISTKRNWKFENEVIREVFNRQKWGKKSPEFCTWFSACSQEYRRMIKDFHFPYFDSQIWLHLPRDDSHFFFSFSYGWWPLWLLTKVPKTNTGRNKKKFAHVFVLCQGPGLGFRVLWPGLRPFNGSDWIEWKSTAPGSDLERRYVCVCERMTSWQKV
jgi:hypothetical protein